MLLNVDSWQLFCIPLRKIELASRCPNAKQPLLCFLFFYFFSLHALSNGYFFDFTENFPHLVWLILSQEMDLCWETGVRAPKLLQFRELYGNVIPFKKRKRNFKEEFWKIQISQPVVCSLMIGLYFLMYCFSSFCSPCLIFYS